ncbi:unnamed protein product, partial [Ixodes persulcatus]
VADGRPEAAEVVAVEESMSTLCAPPANSEAVAEEAMAAAAAATAGVASAEVASAVEATEVAEAVVASMCSWLRRQRPPPVVAEGDMAAEAVDGKPAEVEVVGKRVEAAEAGRPEAVEAAEAGGEALVVSFPSTHCACLKSLLFVRQLRPTPAAPWCPCPRPKHLITLRKRILYMIVQSTMFTFNKRRTKAETPKNK